VQPLPKRHVYVLRSLRCPKRHYIGLTSDLDARLDAHNTGQSKHTAKHMPWEVRVALSFAEAECAAAFERFLKSGSGRAFTKRHFE